MACIILNNNRRIKYEKRTIRESAGIKREGCFRTKSKENKGAGNKVPGRLRKSERERSSSWQVSLSANLSSVSLSRAARLRGPMVGSIVP